MVEFCEMCKLLNNKLKLEMLVRMTPTRSLPSIILSSRMTLPCDFLCRFSHRPLFIKSGKWQADDMMRGSHMNRLRT